MPDREVVFGRLNDCLEMVEKHSKGPENRMVNCSLSLGPAQCLSRDGIWNVCILSLEAGSLYIVLAVLELTM